MKQNRSNKTYSARLTRWLDRLAHFDIKVNHIAGKHLALTDYLSRHPVAAAESDDIYDEEYVINNIAALQKFTSNFGCLSNVHPHASKEINQLQSEKIGKQTTEACESGSSGKPLVKDRNHQAVASNFISQHKNSHQTIMDQKTVEELEKLDQSEETVERIKRWREIVKPGEYRVSGGIWKRYRPPKYQRNEQIQIESKLWEVIRNVTQAAEPVNEWQPEGLGTSTMNTEMDQQNTDEEIRSELTVQAVDLSKYTGCKSIQYIKMGRASYVQSAEQGKEQWDIAEAVRKADKNFATDLEFLMKETTDDEVLLKTLVCLERQQHEQIPEEMRIYKNKLSTRYGLLFYEDKIVIPGKIRQQIIMLLHKGHHSIIKMTDNAELFWWPRIAEDISRKCNSCIPCRMSGKNIKPNLPSTEKNRLPRLNSPNEEIQLDFIGPLNVNNRKLFILLSVDRYSKWPAACLTKSPNPRNGGKIFRTVH